MSQTMFIQRLALLHIPQLNPEFEEELLSSPAMYQEVQNEFMINYFDVARMTLNVNNSKPKENLSDIASSSSSTHTTRQNSTLPGAVASYVEIPVGTSCVPVVKLYHLGIPDRAVLPRRPGSRRQNNNVSIRSDVIHKANTFMLHVNYKVKSRMDSVNYETKLPSMPNTIKPTMFNNSYNETMMQEWNEDELFHEH